MADEEYHFFREIFHEIRLDVDKGLQKNEKYQELLMNVKRTVDSLERSQNILAASNKITSCISACFNYDFRVHGL